MQIDYKKIGFKSGLEIHQQLDSHKLFCNCPSVLRSDEPEKIVRRKLHAIAGESGEIDVAAKHEAKKDKEFIYQVYDTTCLVELDEEPPHEINLDALEIALHISLLLNCEIQPITQIMRKTVIDGSNTSGFQRTVMIARDGFVETSRGKIRVEHVFLEEDSARTASDEEERTSSPDNKKLGWAGARGRDGEFLSGGERTSKIYKLDRLGIPLVEIATAPDILDAEHAKETALKIGEILRSCKVRRGIGTIRQDINISVRGSSRVELKGFQEPKIMIQTVENEVMRQLDILEKIKSNKNPKEKQRGQINKTASKGGSEPLGEHLGEQFRGSSIIHKELRARLGIGDNRTNLEKEAMPQVRKVLPDATSEFMRPMPGSARMYPETDLPLLKISRDIINSAKKTLPKERGEEMKELEKNGLTREMIQILFKQNKLEDFKALTRVINSPSLIAKMILMWPKEIAKRENVNLEELEEKLGDIYSNILEELQKKKIQESDIKEIMTRLAKGVEFSEAIKIEKIRAGDIEEQIQKLIKSKPGLNANAYMGLVMAEMKGKVDGKKVMEVIRKYLR